MTVDEILAAVPRLSALVVGDVCLDRWCFYEPRFAEPSRETGIPRVAVTEFARTPGAAGTVASNLVSLGAGSVALLGVIGDDGHGWELERALREKSIECAGLIRDASGITFTYTKLINCSTGAEDRPRVDYVPPRDLSSSVEDRVLAAFQRLAPQYDVILVSDQMELQSGGVVTARLRSTIEEFAAAHPDTPVWVDSRTRAELFRGVLVKLNEEEAQQACERLGEGSDHDRLRRRIGHPVLIVTKGAEGAVVVTHSGSVPVAAPRVPQPIDICGAGDSFSAGGSLAIRLTRDPVKAAHFGNLVASITIMKPGTGNATPAEVRARSNE